MSKPPLLFLFCLFLVFADPSLDAAQSQPKKVQYNDQNDDDDYSDNVYIEEDNTDIWFGPGFYYGFWFDNESDYWGWRGNHWDYPSNRNYYNHDHPIHYNHDGNRRDRDGRGDGGRDHGGGGRGGERGGGGHGGGGHR